MIMRLIEGTCAVQGTVSGTDQTPMTLTNAAEHATPNILRVWIENPTGGPTFAVTSINTVTGTVTLNGTDGITVLTDIPTKILTVSGFRSEFVNASGTLSAEIDSDIAIHTATADAHHSRYTDAEAIASLEPTTSALAASGVATDTAVSANTTLITTTSGYLQTQIDGIVVDEVEPAIIGSDGITVTSGSTTTTISAFYAEFTNASGTLSTEIDTDIATHAAITDAHHSRYTDAEAIAALEPTTSALAASGVATDANIVSVSGHLQTQIDSFDSGIIPNALVGSDGITVTSGVSTDTISGFYAEFTNASGTLSTEIDNDIATHAANTSAHHTRYSKNENDAIVAGANIVVTSGANTITIESTGGGGGGTVSNALVGSDGITVTSGVSTDTISGFYTEFTSASGVLSKISKSLSLENPGASEDVSFFYTDENLTVTEINAVLVGTTSPLVTWTFRHAASRNDTGTEVVTGGTTTTAQGAGDSVISFDNATISGSSHIWLETTALSGSVNWLSLTLFAERS